MRSRIGRSVWFTEVMSVRNSRRAAIGMVVLSPFVLVLAFALLDTVGVAATVTVLTVWTLGFLVVAALSLRRNAPIEELESGPSPADELALDLDDRERSERIARADRDGERLRISEPSQRSIGPYHLP